ncbi:MAG: hypothetical protein K2O06_06190 [Acetatifactor sp.]|nr:hypothetical protein [Acetatifactor sp.]
MKKGKPKKRKYYLIDTENVGDRWIEYIPRLEGKNILVVFYTKNHSRLLEEYYLKQRYNRRIRWVECVEGNNALDQQLTGVLAYLIAAHPGADYRILSNDNDYNKIVDFGAERGVHVERTGTDPAAGKSGDSGLSDWFEILTSRIGERSTLSEIQGISRASIAKETPEALERDPVECSEACAIVRTVGADNASEQTGECRPEAVMTTEQIQQKNGVNSIPWEAGVKAMILEVARAVPVKNLSGWHAALTCLFGAETGKQYYLRLKGDKECARVFSEYLIPDEEKRNVYLIALIFWHGRLDVRAAEETYKAIAAHRKNRKAIRGEVNRRLAGKTEEPAQYYRAVKPLVSCLLWRE